jgi:HK97 family phage major capsid protein/HK97 family phage prohead protease
LRGNVEDHGRNGSSKTAQDQVIDVGLLSRSMALRRRNPFLPGMALQRDGSPVAPPFVADDRTAFRSLTIDSRSINEENRTVELSFSSDIELERWPGVIEVLSHEPGAVELTRLLNGAQLLFNHDRDDYIGVIESAKIGADRKGRCVARFSEHEDAEKVWNDVKAGILRNVSVGYRILEVKLTEERESGVDVWTVTRWEPYEVSIVTIPADITVGIGRDVRSLFSKPQPNSPNSQNRSIMNRAQIIAMLRQLGVSFQDSATDEELSALLQRSLPTNQPAPAPAPAPAPRVQVVDENAARAAGESAERERTRSIYDAGRKFEQTELAQKAVEEGKSLEEFRTMLLDAVDAKNKQVVDGSKPIGLSDKEARGFSVVKLFRALSADADSRAKYNKEAAFELEACRAAADQMTHRSAKGTVIPVDVLLQPLTGQRADTIIGAKTAAGYTNAGTNSIQTLLLTSSFIDVLRNRSVMMGLITELSGLVGNIDIPKQLTGSAAEWIGEDEAGAKNDITFGIVSLRPKTVTNRAELTRRILMQNSLGVEALVRADMIKTLALAIDLAALYGTNANNQPKGLVNQSGINTGMWATDDAPTFAELVAMETEIAADNADIGSMAYVANARMRGHMKTTQKFTGGGDTGTLWEPGGTVNGYRTEITNQVANGDVFFGNWSDLLMGMWGGLDVTVDPYTHSDKGRIRITQFQDVDFAIRRAESFSYYKTNPA